MKNNVSYPLNTHSQLKMSYDKLPLYTFHRGEFELLRLATSKAKAALVTSSSCPNLLKQQNKQKELKKRLKRIFPELYRSTSQYRPIRIIGQGAYSIVCEAEDLRNGRRVAIKKISNMFANDKEAIRTLREIKILNYFKVKHPDNLLAFFDLIVTSSAQSHNNRKQSQDLLLVSDILERDLADLLEKNGRMRSEDRRRVLFSIVCGVNALHSANIIHRDLRPKNILLRKMISSPPHSLHSDGGSDDDDDDKGDLECKYEGVVCDFGMSRTHSMRMSLLSFTTVDIYSPPEGLIGKKSNYTKSVDIWAIGCILVEMITGHRFVRPEILNASSSSTSSSSSPRGMNQQINMLKFIFQMIMTSENDIFQVKEMLKEIDNLYPSSKDGDDNELSNNNNNSFDDDDNNNDVFGDRAFNAFLKTIVVEVIQNPFLLTQLNPDIVITNDDDRDDENKKQPIIATLKNYIGNEVSDAEIDILQKIFKLNPDDRITTAELLKHPYFSGLVGSDDQNMGRSFEDAPFEYDDSDLEKLSSVALQAEILKRINSIPHTVY